MNDTERIAGPVAGMEVIRAQLKQLPSSPGVYRMLDEKGSALYVGKAKSLKNRVASYVSAAGLSTRILTMLSHTRAFEIVTTHTEAEALLLEANLIKKLKPRYNILLRDDKSFPYILITGDGPYPQITKHRGAQTRKGHYFGPFASVQAVNETIAILQKAFLLRPCPDTIFKNRTRPCLQYQIKRCSAPCVEKISARDYQALVEQARLFFMGKNREIQEALVREMQTASDAHEYEKAAILRDRIRALTTVQQEQKIHAPSMGDADVFALHRQGGASCVQVFFFRAGQNYGNKSYFPAHTQDAVDADVLAAVIGQFYQTNMPPKLVLVSHPLENTDLIAEALSLAASYRVEIAHPQKGDKRDALEQALANARLALESKLSEQASVSGLLDQVAEIFGLDGPPARIEVYDNSHIAGSHAVGAMIVAGPEGFMKKHYRRYNFRSETLEPGDDYGMLREVLTRRFVRLQKEEGDGVDENRPGLLLIDGGQGQLTVTQQVLEEAGISDIPFAAISKGPDRNAGREWFHMPGREPFQLPAGSPALHYLQRLRDEAHRFAIGSHRMKRAKAIHASPLDEISGIGGTRKRALLLHFGSAKDVEVASLEELQNVEGISKQIALKIYRHFHK